MARGSGKTPQKTTATAARTRNGDSSSRSSSPRRREVTGIVVGATALFLLGSVASVQLGDGTLMGPAGATSGLGLYAIFGIGSWLVAAGLGWLAFGLLRGRAVRLRSAETAGFVGGALSLALLLHLAAGGFRLHGYSAGGLVGEYTAELCAAGVGKVGAVLLGLAGLALATVACTPITMAGVGRVLAGGGRQLAGVLFTTARTTLINLFPAADDDAGDLADELDETDAVPRKTLHESDTELLSGRRGRDANDTMQTPVIAPAPEAPESRKGRRKLRDSAAAPAITAGPSEATVKVDLDARGPDVAPVAIEEADRTEVTAAPPLEGPLEKAPEAKVDPAPAIIAPLARKPAPELGKPRPRPEDAFDASKYKLPDLSLLNFDDPTRGELDKQSMLDLAGRLEKTLADYGVTGRVSEIHPGPVVTMYEFQPKAGTKLSKITALSNDLAMALEALKVRIVAPIPGKAAVGIEVPNKGRETVYLKEIIGDDSFTKNKSKLTLALGKDIAGRPVSVDLAKMPHLLIAGTTGSGKSVSVNGMICSILFNASPEDVKMIMIDPKMLELSIYEGIPHLLLPVVTDPKKANLALRWAVDEMERRYDLISKAGVRDIASYNKRVLKAQETGPHAIAGKAGPPGTRLADARNEPQKITVAVQTEAGPREIEVEATEQAVTAAGGVIDANVLDDISGARAAKQVAEAKAVEEAPRKLPYILVVIDEFADLMMVASKEVETSVARIAQKARAAGIHLLLATQRPSVDVITGLIKANFPSRIAFQVASKIDARTILDQQGAECLLGMGDMLFTDRGLAPRRVHGPLVTDVEIRGIVDFLKAQGKPVYDLDILKPRESDGEGEGPSDEKVDEFYDQAVAAVAETRIASVSMIQRRLGVGYNRAAKMIERMEREGIVGPANGSKPREVLVASHAA